MASSSSASDKRSLGSGLGPPQSRLKKKVENANAVTNKLAIRMVLITRFILMVETSKSSRNSDILTLFYP